jgi:hypothetical protein
MRQLSDILIEKKKKLGRWAEIGRLLGGRDGQLIGKYASGKSIPALDFAIDWKKAFGENLISMMFEEEPTPVVEEPTPAYGVVAELAECRKKLIECMEERDALKNFARGSEGKTKLKKG